jgi:hypothetical protein
MGLNFIDRIFYDSAGYTGNTYYCRFVKKADGQVFDNNAGALASAPTWANSVVTMTETPAASGQYPVVIPTSLPQGVYDVIIYLQAGGSPANTDDVANQYDTVNGGIFRF